MSSREGVKRIVVGVDGSTHSATALKWAIRLARGMGSQITAVYAIHVPVYFPEPYTFPAQFDETWRSELEQDFEEKWCRPLKQSGVKYRTVVQNGRPASVIAGVAESENADVVIVGRRGRGGVAELLLGSVSHEVVLTSKKPVLVIPPTAART